MAPPATPGNERGSVLGRCGMVVVVVLVVVDVDVDVDADDDDDDDDGALGRMPYALFNGTVCRKQESRRQHARGGRTTSNNDTADDHAPDVRGV